MPVQGLRLSGLNGHFKQTQGVIFEKHAVIIRGSMNGLRSQRPFQHWLLGLRLGPGTAHECAADCQRESTDS
jgi:hypothetical protein